MRWFHRRMIGAKMLFRRKRESERLDEELRYHLDRQIAENIAAGMPADEARYAALRSFGNPVLLREQARSTWSWNWLELLLNDVRYSIRILARAPGFAATAILVMAAGVGVSTAIFSAVRAVLLAPLPYDRPERLVQVISKWRKSGEQFVWTAPLRDAPEWKATVPALEDVAMYRYSLLNLKTGDHAESLYGIRATANLLPMLGVRPQLGSWFPAEYDRPNTTHVLVLSDDLWRRRFNADPHIVRKTVQMDGEDYQVLGVMPKGFNFPLKLATTALLPTDQMQYWIPLGADFAKEPHGAPNSGVIARLKDGITVSQAQQQLEAACALLQRQYPATNANLSANLVSLRYQTVRQVSAALLALLAATGLILLLTCGNIASLLLARGEMRASELAVRMALGGSARRVALLPMLQGLLLCCCGCLLGVPFAIFSLRLLIRLAPIDVPRLADASIDFDSILFAAALTVSTGLIIGGLNSLQVLRRSPREVLSGAGRNSGGRPRTKLRSTLVAGQIALAVVLVSSAGLMLRTFLNLLSADTGYRVDGVVYGVTVLPPSKYPQPEQRELFFKRVLDQLRAQPGVQFAAVSTGFPFVGQYDGVKVETPELLAGNRDSGILADFNAVSSSYLEAVDVRLLQGRLLAESDTTGKPNVAVIDQNLARTLWPGQDPLGKRINTNDPAKPVWREVVGVVAPLRNRSFDTAIRPSVFAPLSQAGGYVNFIVLRSSAGTEPAARMIRSAVAAVDSEQGVFFTQSLPELIRDTVAVRRFLFITLAFFGGAALALSALGIYSVVSFIAASRVREIGIRMALGATRGSVAALVISDGLRLMLIGAAVGSLGSILVSRLLKDMLFGVRPLDLESLAFTVAILGMAATLAAFLPARRAASVEPMRALRMEN